MRHMNHLPNLTYREHVSRTDIDKLRHLVTATGVFNPEEIAIAVELAEQALEEGPASGYEFLFAEQDGQLAGYSCFGRIPFTAGRYDLYWIATAPNFQGQGLGNALLQQSEAIIHRQQGRIIYIETSSRAPYEPARQLYLRCGYEQVALLADFYADGDDKLIFAKRLKP